MWALGVGAERRGKYFARIKRAKGRCSEKVCGTARLKPCPDEVRSPARSIGCGAPRSRPVVELRQFIMQFDANTGKETLQHQLPVE